jgi:hypothetical protein
MLVSKSSAQVEYILRSTTSYAYIRISSTTREDVDQGLVRTSLKYYIQFNLIILNYIHFQSPTFSVVH